MAALSVQQKKEFAEALQHAYPEKYKLARMLEWELGKNLEAIASSESNLEQGVFALIKTAEAEGWIDQLISAAFKGNSNNEKLLKFHWHYQKEKEPLSSPDSQNISRQTLVTLPATGKQIPPSITQSKVHLTEPAHNSDETPVQENTLHVSENNIPQSVTKAVDSLKDAYAIFTTKGDIRLPKCPKTIQSLQAISESLQEFSLLLGTQPLLLKSIDVNYGHCVVIVDRIKGQTRMLISAIQEFRRGKNFLRRIAPSQAIQEQFKELESLLNELVTIVHK